MNARLAAALTTAAALALPASAEADDMTVIGPEQARAKARGEALGGPHGGARYWNPKPTRAQLRRRMMRRVTAPYRGWLLSTRLCESRGNYWTNTGNGFYGAYQFTLQSWAAVGGWGLPSNAPPLEQDYRAVKLLHVQGPGAWPVCG
jgi:hypothetical protein